jgi:hypothetical protein
MTFAYNQYKALDASKALVSLGFKSIYRESSTVELYTDWDMELPGTANYNPVNGAVLSKVAGGIAPGVQCLRSTTTPGTPYPMIQPISRDCTPGKRYRFRAYYRCPASGVWILDGGGATMFLGPADLNWHPVDVVYTAAGLRPYMYLNDAVGLAGYVEWDNVSLVAEYSKTPNIGTLGGGAILGADGFTPASMPSLMPNQGMKFDGSDDIVQMQHAGELSFRSGGVDLPFSVEILANYEQLTAATQAFFGKGVVVGAPGGWGMYASGVLVFLLGDAAGNYFGKALASPWDRVACISEQHLLVTYDGSGLAAGVMIYHMGVAPPQSPNTVGVYTGQPANTDPVVFGRTRITPGVSYYSKSQPTFDAKIWPFCMTPGQAKIRCARALAEKRLI